MIYGETKVYFDGSHYIAIPHIPNPHRKKKTVETDEDEMMDEDEEFWQDEDLIEIEIEDKLPFYVDNEENEERKNDEKVKENMVEKTVSVKDLKAHFDVFYKQALYMSKSERMTYLVDNMKQYFDTVERTKDWVEKRIERKHQNLISRRIRLSRKINLQEFNYFCTFTYDDKKHDEESFKKKLADTFKKMCHRRHWKYVGVWERSPKKQRLHFHGLFYIPKGQMVGEIVEVQDYSPIKDKVQTTHQNTYFNERFGRSDFSLVDNSNALMDAMAYLMKYLEKTGEKIVYSKGLPEFFISDINEDDVVCRIGKGERKFLLFDDFTCMDEGCIVGTVSKDTIAQLRKVN